MRVPKSFNQVTVSQYQRVVPIYKKIEKETDSLIIASDWARIISILSDVTPAEVENLPLSQLTSIIKSLDWLVQGKMPFRKRKYLFINGTLHVAKRKGGQFSKNQYKQLLKVKTEAFELDTAQYVEVETFKGRGVLENLHNIAATIYSPLTIKGFRHDGIDHSKRAEAFLQMSAAKVLPAVFFYSKAYKNLIRRIQEYGIKLQREKMKEADQLLMSTLREALENIGDGTAR